MTSGLPGNTRQGGFTLLEVLIAVTVTAVIGIGVWQLLGGVISAKNGIDRVSDQFSRMQQAVVIMERDLAQIVFRPVRDAYGEALPAVTSRTEPWSIEFSRSGWRNPLQNARSDLQRVAYEVVDGGVLRRHYWQVLDRAQDSVTREQDMLEGVTSLTWRFLDQKREWQAAWPSDSQLQGLPVNGGATVPLPLAVEVTLEHKQFGRIRRLIDLGGFDPEQIPLTGAGANPETDRAQDPAQDPGGGMGPQDGTGSGSVPQ